MKLLFCEDCYDVFKLDTDEERACKCGKVTGHYVNNMEAVTNGKGISLAIGNGSLIKAMVTMSKSITIDTINNKYDRDYFIKNCNIKYAWVRPNEGEGNPHTKVVE